MSMPHCALLDRLGSRFRDGRRVWLAVGLPLLLALVTVFPVTGAAIELGDNQYEKIDGQWHLLTDTGERFLVDTETITVRFRSQVSEADQFTLHETVGTELVRTNRLGFADLRVSPETDVIEVVTRYLESALVASAEPNTIGRYEVIPFDPRFRDQWHHDQTNGADINSPEAWDLEVGSASVLVGVLDSGTDWTHNDMGLGNDGYQNIFLHPGEDAWSNPNNPGSGNGIDDDNNGFVDDWKGWDFGNGNNDSRGSFDHGTRVAGIVSAKTGNGFGISGVAGGMLSPGALAMTLGVGDSSPIGSILDDAIIYATDNGARVITMSLTVGQTSAIDAALEYAYQSGVFIDCASGNSGGSVSYPARNPNVVAVGATGQTDLIASFSSRGVDQEVAAPGVSILSCVFNNGFSAGNGTSFAAPIVAGVAALMFSHNPTLTNTEVRQILRDTADKVGPYDYNWNAGMPGHSRELGYGRVNAASAVQAVSTVGVNDPTALVISPLSVGRNSPNPFNPTTDIRYSLRSDGRVNVTILSASGRLVATLLDRDQTAGTHTVSWDGRDHLGNTAASGVYFYRISVGEFTSTRKMLLTR